MKSSDSDDSAAVKARSEDAPAPLSERCVRAAIRIAKMAERAERREMAELRRLGRPGHAVPSATAWKFIDRYALESEQDAWLVMLPLMTRVQHVRGSLGRAIYDAGISALRLERWLRRDRAGALREARLLLRRMESTGVPWNQTGELLHEWSDGKRKLIARDFFRAKRKADRPGASTSNSTTHE